MRVCDLVRFLRTSSRARLRETAGIVGISAGHLSHIEHGKRSPSRAVLLKLASLSRFELSEREILLLAASAEDAPNWVSLAFPVLPQRDNPVGEALRLSQSLLGAVQRQGACERLAALAARLLELPREAAENPWAAYILVRRIALSRSAAQDESVTTAVDRALALMRADVPSAADLIHAVEEAALLATRVSSQALEAEDRLHQLLAAAKSLRTENLERLVSLATWLAGFRVTVDDESRAVLLLMETLTAPQREAVIQLLWSFQRT